MAGHARTTNKAMKVMGRFAVPLDQMANKSRVMASEPTILESGISSLGTVGSATVPTPDFGSPLFMAEQKRKKRQTLG